MKEQLISFETAKLAKKSYFPHINLGLNNMYDNEGNFYNSVGPTFDETDSFQAPPQSLVQKWLRNKLIFVNVVFDPITHYHYCYITQWNIRPIDVFNELEENKKQREFNSYEEALEKGLQEALKILNTPPVKSDK